MQKIIFFVFAFSVMTKILLAEDACFWICDSTSKQASILISHQASLEEKEAAQEFSSYLKKTTDKKWLVEIESRKSFEGNIISIGETELFKKSGLKFGDVDDDSIMMAVRENVLFLAGKTPLATRFCVSRFLYEYAGVRWYMPTELGEHVPKLKELKIPRIEKIESPAFISRGFYKVAVFDKKQAWEKRNYIHRIDQHYHHLYRVFKRELFEKHSDWFPFLKGKRYCPRDEKDDDWHPCYSNEEAAHYAGKFISEFFDQNPQYKMGSLCINDGTNFCECPKCPKAKEFLANGKTFRGRPDFSDVVFKFTNIAAEEIAKKHPDKLVTQYAYYDTENAPSFKVRDNVLVYLTADRAQWVNEEFKKEDQDLILRWQQKAKHIGIYDYYYGEGYAIPRQFNREIAESIQFFHQQGIRRFFAEMNTIWSLDGPKAWLAAQLLWNPNQKYEDLLDDYYRNFFQESSAPMKAYFELCEKRWRGQSGKASWLKYRSRTSQFELFPSEVCEEARGYLNQASALAKDDVVRKRVKLFSDGFRTAELWSQIYFISKKLWDEEIHSQKDYESVMADLQKLIDAKKNLDFHQKNIIEKNDLHHSEVPFERELKQHPVTKLNPKILVWVQQSEKFKKGREILKKLKEVESVFGLGEFSRAFEH